MMYLFKPILSLKVPPGGLGMSSLKSQSRGVFWWEIFAVCEYHSWCRVLKFGMNTPLYYMNMYTKNHFSSFFRLVRIHSFLCIFKNFKCQLRQKKERSLASRLWQFFAYVIVQLQSPKTTVVLFHTLGNLSIFNFT